MNILQIITQPFGGVLGLVLGGITDWARRRGDRKEVEHQAYLADLLARKELAAYKAKSDVEWDLKSFGQQKSTWRDDYILILWTIPAFVLFPCFFIPGLRDYAMETLMFLQGLHPDIISWYMAGWGMIFSATFGLKQAVQMMIPGKIPGIAEAFQALPDDIPESIAKAAQNKIGQALGNFVK